jgi:CPA2 family monovalent cation:H+ antiporter-2
VRATIFSLVIVWPLAYDPAAMESHLFLDLAFIFIAATIGGVIAWRLNLPLILGFVAGGIAISPFTPGLKIHDIHTFHELAEAGVVLLMFSIGVEFSVPDLLRVKWVAIGGCILGISLSLGLSIGIAKLAGWGVTQGAVIGAAISVASTMVLAQLLTGRGVMGTTYGRAMIGITLVEDLAVVLMTVVLQSVGSSEHGGMQQAAWTLGKALVLLIPLAFLAMKVIPIVLRWAQRTNNPELALLFPLSICLGTAALAHAIGFSVALGAFLAGLAISASKDLHEAHENLVPLRDAFVALFFVSLGTLIEPDVIRRNLPLLGIMLILIIPGKFVIWFLVTKLFRYSNKHAIIIAAGLTQIGELSFVVVQVAAATGMVSADVFNATLAASLISIFVNVFLVRAVFAWADPKSSTEIAETAHA